MTITTQPKHKGHHTAPWEEKKEGETVFETIYTDVLQQSSTTRLSGVQPTSQLETIIVAVTVTVTIVIAVWLSVLFFRRNIKSKKRKIIERYVSRYAKYGYGDATDIDIMRAPTGGYHGTYVYEFNLAQKSDDESTVEEEYGDEVGDIIVETIDTKPSIPPLVVQSDSLFWKATASVDYLDESDEDDDDANAFGLMGDDEEIADSIDCI